MKLKITRQTEVTVTSEFLAEMFWEMNADEQAEFFNHIGELTNADEWGSQVDAILESDALDKIGRRRMEAFVMAGTE